MPATPAQTCSCGRLRHSRRATAWPAAASAQSLLPRAEPTERSAAASPASALSRRPPAGGDRHPSAARSRTRTFVSASRSLEEPGTSQPLHPVPPGTLAPNMWCSSDFRDSALQGWGRGEVRLHSVRAPRTYPARGAYSDSGTGRNNRVIREGEKRDSLRAHLRSGARDDRGRGRGRRPGGPGTDPRRGRAGPCPRRRACRPFEGHGIQGTDRRRRARADRRPTPRRLRPRGGPRPALRAKERPGRRRKPRRRATGRRRGGTADEPPGARPPAEFADLARARAEGAGLTAEILDEKALAERSMNGILGVGQDRKSTRLNSSHITISYA